MKILFENGLPVIPDCLPKIPDFNFVTYLTVYKGTLLPPCYIGSTTAKKAISGNYFGSVKSKKWKSIFEKELLVNKHLFSNHILSYHQTRKAALVKELEIQKENDVVKSKLFFNEAFAEPNGYFGRDVSGKNHPMYDKHIPSGKKGETLLETLTKKYGLEEAKIRCEKISEKISLGLKDKYSRDPITSEHKSKISKSTLGVKKTEEHIKNMSIAQKKIIFTEDRREKLSKAVNYRKLDAILQFNLDGFFIKKWKCAREIYTTLGIQVGMYVKGKRKDKIFKNFIWEYEKNMLQLPDGTFRIKNLCDK